MPEKATNFLDICNAWECTMVLVSDVIFPGLFEFPENREFPGIQSNFPGIPGNLLKAAFFLDLQGAIS